MPALKPKPGEHCKYLLTFYAEVHNLMHSGRGMDNKAFLSRIEVDVQKIDDRLKKLQAEMAELQRHKEVLLATHVFYSQGVSEKLPPTGPADLSQLTIAPACEAIFAELGNQWMSLKDLERELGKHGRHTLRQSVDLALKNKPDRFERERRGNKYFYRLASPGLRVVNMKEKQQE